MHYTPLSIKICRNTDNTYYIDLNGVRIAGYYLGPATVVETQSVTVKNLLEAIPLTIIRDELIRAVKEL